MPNRRPANTRHRLELESRTSRLGKALQNSRSRHMLNNLRLGVPYQGGMTMSCKVIHPSFF
jgi:hypothetical protein